MSLLIFPGLSSLFGDHLCSNSWRPDLANAQGDLSPTKRSLLLFPASAQCGPFQERFGLSVATRRREETTSSFGRSLA